MAATRGSIPVMTSQENRDLTQEILDQLSTKESINTSNDFPEINQLLIKAALDRLASRSMITYDTSTGERVQLTEEGQQIHENGSHEYRVWAAVHERKRLALKDLAPLVGADAAKVGQGNAFKLKWIKKDGDDLVPLQDSPADSTREALSQMLDSDVSSLSAPKTFSDFRKRKLVTTKKHIHYTAAKGPKYARQMPVEHTDLTPEMLENGSWQTANFKPYNFAALGADQNAGALHPLNKVRSEIRNIFFYMGFVEMPTSRYVDSGFWNFDALFVPQQHPARDLQDTFYVSDPAEADLPRDDPIADAALDAMEGIDSSSSTLDYEKYYSNIRQVHGQGGFGSIGYRAPFADSETRRLVLRTHTTAVSTYCLHRLSRSPRPCRYFSIDRVFRNETVDATHLAEFHQVEGVIADYGLTLGGLMGFLQDFFKKLLGTSSKHALRFKPAYNPYTEPSMEIYAFHQGLDKWVEIGNSGLFRPEMLRSMGLPENLMVYGFGLSLERPTMIKYGVNKIRELLGHKVRLDFIESNPAVRFDRD